MYVGGHCMCMYGWTVLLHAWAQKANNHNSAADSVNVVMPATVNYCRCRCSQEAIHVYACNYIPLQTMVLDILHGL